ncbi:MAG: phosphoglycerate dehydrogenase [Schleiferiaceae bacterium]
MKVLLTSTSFQDCDGIHKKILDEQGWKVTYLRGPLKKEEIIKVISRYDALICGDDELDHEVLQKGFEGNLRYISKYGVGLDKIDLIAAKNLNIPIMNCPGVNQMAVSEHVIAMIFSFLKNIHLSHGITKNGGWERPLGNNLHGKKIGIIGLGSVGKETAKLAKAFGLNVFVFDLKIDREFILKYELTVESSITEILSKCDIVSLHIPLLKSTKGIISREKLLKKIKPGLILVNTSRAGLVEEQDIIDALDAGRLRGYLTDVLSVEPMSRDCLIKNRPGVLITPHVGSRTKETIQMQGKMAVENLCKLINVGKEK